MTSVRTTYLIAGSFSALACSSAGSDALDTEMPGVGGIAMITGGAGPFGGMQGSGGASAGGNGGVSGNGNGGVSGSGIGGNGNGGAGNGGASGSGNGGSGNGGGSGSGNGGAGGSGNGGSGNGGVSGSGNGGASGRGNGGTGGSGGAFPCDGTTAGYDVVVSESSGTWSARRGATVVYTGADMRAAMQAGIDSLSSGRTSKQSVLVQGSGSISAGARVSVASFTVLNVCGTIDVTGSGSGDMAPIYARGRTDIEIPNLNITGTPVYGMFFRDVDNLSLGKVDIRVSTGLGIRIDNHGRTDRANKVKNIRIDDVYVEGTETQGVETYGVDGIVIGTVVARRVHDSGLLLNDTVNAEVGRVDAVDTGTGTGYAAFRMANRNGRIGDAYPVNVHVGEVIARRGGRGVFCVSESGGAVIDHVDIADAGNNSILIENCYNVTIAAQSGTVTGGGDIRIAARTQFANTSDVTIQNLTVTNSAINENPCAVNSTFANNMLVNSTSNVCN